MNNQSTLLKEIVKISSDDVRKLDAVIDDIVYAINECKSKGNAKYVCDVVESFISKRNALPFSFHFICYRDMNSGWYGKKLVTINLYHCCETQFIYKPPKYSIPKKLARYLTGDDLLDEIKNDYPSSYKIKSVKPDSLKSTIYHEFVHVKQDELYTAKTGKSYEVTNKQKYDETYEENSRENEAFIYSLIRYIEENLKSFDTDERKIQALKMLKSEVFSKLSKWKELKEKNPKAYKKALTYAYKHTQQLFAGMEK